jgi:hypothetical protein
MDCCQSFEGRFSALERDIAKILAILERPKGTRKKKEVAESRSFVEFWEKYPRKVNRRGALQIWASQELDESAGQIMAGLDGSLAEWRRERTREHYIPHPTTWLNQGRWEQPAAKGQREMSDQEIFKMVSR